MTVINSVNGSKLPYQPNVPSAPEKKKKSLPIKISAGIGLTALAASGIYIASRGKTQNLSLVLSQLQNSAGVFNILKNTKLSPKDFKVVMYKITGDEKLSKKFIEEMISNPRKSKENVRILSKKIGGDKELIDWMLKPKGYQEAYNRYTKDVFANAKHPDDLMKLSPNWSIWRIKEKFGNDFTIGEPPKEFGGVDNYRKIFKNTLGDGRHNVDGIQFENYILGGLSGKGVRSLEAGGKKYILKYQADDLYHNNESIKDNLSMKSDSTFLNAQLDRFLSLNNYNQNAKLKFFDYKTNSALYEMTEGSKPESEEIVDLFKTNKKLNDLNSLGVYYNDVNCGNFLLDKDKLCFIDSGESTFIDFFKPLSDFQFALPNHSGKSITDSAAAINLSKI